MANDKELYKERLEEFKKELSFIKEQISRKGVLKEFISLQDETPQKELPIQKSGDEVIEKELNSIPQSKFKAQIDKVRSLALEAMKELSYDTKCPEYDFFKKIWLECDKYENQKKVENKIDSLEKI